MLENLHLQYSFPTTAIKLIQAMAPENIKGELWTDAYKLTLQ